MSKVPGVLRVATLCEELGERLVTNPFAHIPKVKALLEEHVHSLEDLGPVLRNADYRRGKGRNEQPYRILDKEWLSSGAAAKEICSVNLLETDYVAITAFSLPAGTNLPLHDHPGMHVLCKVLNDGGPLHHWSFDWDYDGARRSESEEGREGMMRMDERLHGLKSDEEQLWRSAMQRLARTQTAQPPSGTDGGLVPAPENALGAARGPLRVDLPEKPDILKAAIKKERRIEDLKSVVQGLQSAHLHGLRRSGVLGRGVEEVLPNAVLVSSGAVGETQGPLDAPGSVRWIRPFQGGTLHRFSATSSAPTCFIDVITPPYYRDGTGNIPCTYFSTGRPKQAGKDADVVTPIRVGDRACLRPLPGPPGSLVMDGHTAGYLIG